jgi:prepilin-type N-terminal cleavage/methylation domain-containing protein
MAMRSRRGFTLIELLAATALFSVLGAMLFQMVTGAMDLWSRGERVRELEDRAGAVLDLLTEDLRHVWSGAAGAGEQEARFLLEWREDGGDGAPLPGRRSAVLRFTRVLHEARSVAWLRRAGERPAASEVATLVREEDPDLLRPTGGLAESLYATTILPGDVLPSLVRRVRTPVGGAGSLLDPLLVDREDRLLEDSLPLADRVLHLGVLAWAPASTVWEPLPGADGVPALDTWDSTRGLVPSGDVAFPFGVGPQSLLDGRDDMFPPVLRLELVLDPYADSGRAPNTLSEPVGDGATRLSLRRSGFGGDDRAPGFVWVEGEWMAVVSVDGKDLVVERGVRGTTPRAHDTGAAVRVGVAFRRVVTLPGAREGLGP